jgi:hypothetical protein
MVFIICDYGVDKEKKLKKTKNWKSTFPFLQNKFQIKIYFDTMKLYKTQ